MHLSSRVYRKLGLLVIGALVISALAAGPALARGSRPRPDGSQKCWVDPNPLNQYPWIYNVWGSGFPSGMAVTVFVSDASATWILPGVVGSDGVFGTGDYARFNFSGTKAVTVYQQGDRHMTPWCQTSFDVAF